MDLRAHAFLGGHALFGLVTLPEKLKAINARMGQDERSSTNARGHAGDRRQSGSS